MGLIRYDMSWYDMICFERFCIKAVFLIQNWENKKGILSHLVRSCSSFTVGPGNTICRACDTILVKKPLRPGSTNKRLWTYDLTWYRKNDVTVISLITVSLIWFYYYYIIWLSFIGLLPIIIWSYHIRLIVYICISYDANFFCQLDAPVPGLWCAASPWAQNKCCGCTCRYEVSLQYLRYYNYITWMNQNQTSGTILCLERYAVNISKYINMIKW